MQSNRERPHAPTSLRAPWPTPQPDAPASYFDVTTPELTALDSIARDVKTVLFVDPAPELRHDAFDMLRGMASVTLCSGFADARAALFAEPPDLLVTAVRLRAFNGLHLVHLAIARNHATRAIVFADAADYAIAREVQALGAFFVPVHTLMAALRSYLEADLPPRDRRAVASILQPSMREGGKRSTDR